MGKGDKRRPTQVPEETFEERWKRTFGEEPRPNATPENPWGDVPLDVTIEYDEDGKAIRLTAEEIEDE